MSGLERMDYLGGGLALAQGYPWHLARADPGLRDLHNMLPFDALGTQQRATLSSLNDG